MGVVIRKENGRENMGMDRSEYYSHFSWAGVSVEIQVLEVGDAAFSPSCCCCKR